MLLLACCVTLGLSQRTVTGTIADDTGEALIGVNVIEQGTTNGTITDLDGSFSLNVADAAQTLVVSYTGFTTQNVDISSGQSKLVISLLEGALLDEVVISTFGVDRNSRDIPYANQTVDSESLLSAPNKNALEALRGKASGIKINNSSGSVGASNRIVLRAESSLTGDNNALIVVDGVPIDNAQTRGGATTELFSAQDGYSDYGNRFNDLNPEDIESVTVLKGPSATSLYGSRGAAGVLVITTKSGGTVEGKPEFSYNTSASIEEPYVLLQRQDQYGQGYGLPFASSPQRDSGENWSWGAPFDGVVRPWSSPVDADGDGDSEFLSRPYSAVEDQLEHFFRTGRTFNNNVSMRGNKGGFGYYASYGNVTQYGILENTDYVRHNVKLSANAKLGEKIDTRFSVGYSNVNQNTAQEGYRPFEGQNAYANAVQSPVNIPFGELKDYNSPFHDFDGYYGSYTSNPFFILNEFVNNGKVNNLLGSFSLNYKPIDRLSIGASVGTNIVNRSITESIPVYSYNPHYVWEGDLNSSLRGDRANNVGEFFKLDGTNVNLDVSNKINYEFDLNTSRDIGLNVTVGQNLFQRDTRSLGSRTVGGLVVEDWYHLDNAAGGTVVDQNTSSRWLYGVFGNAQLSLGNHLFLDYSARNDWSSTLPVGNNSFFYQAVGVSAIVSDMLNLQDSDFLNFLKARVSYGTTGKDAPAYSLYSTFIGNPTIQSLANGHDLMFPLNGQSGFTKSTIIGNPNLMPELTTTFEFGIDGGLFNDKINFDYTYYNSVHSNQIVEVSLPASSGYRATFQNIGEMKNNGHELGLHIRPIDGLINGLKVQFDFLYATNTNIVTEIIDPENEGDELVVGNIPGNISIVAKEGYPFGSFKGNVVKTTPDGRTIVDPVGGLPVLADDEEILGSYQPDFTASIGSTIGYKAVSLNFLFDIRKGGNFLSYTKDLTEFNGTALTTLINDREAFVVDNSVTEDADGNYTENTIETNAYDFLRVQPLSTHLIDASFVKLRELGLGFDLSKSFFTKIGLENARLDLFAKNVKFWLPEENTFADPEVNGPSLTGNAVGVETTQTPPSRSFGVRLGVNF